MHIAVHGESGVGKTLLMRHLAAAAGADLEPVRVRCALKHEPYAALAQWLQEVQPRRQARIGVPEQVELARFAPLAFAGVKASESALSLTRLHAAVAHWLRGLGQAGLKVLLLDDLHYADAASQAALASFLHDQAGKAEKADAPGTALTLLLGYRSGEIETALANALADAQARQQARSLGLARLTPAGIHTLLQAMAVLPRVCASEALADQLHRRTGGKPLFVIELARQAAAPGGTADTSNLQALLEARLRSCSALAQQLAAVAAVAATALRSSWPQRCWGKPYWG